MLPPDWEGDSAARRPGGEWCYPQTWRMVVLPAPDLGENGVTPRLGG